MNRSCFETLLGEFPGLAVVTSLDGSLLYCSKCSHELLAVKEFTPAQEKAGDLLACDLLAVRVAALQAQVAESGPQSETFYPQDATGIPAPVHISVYLANMAGSEAVVVTQLSILSPQNVETIGHIPSAEQKARDTSLLENRYQVLTALNHVTVRMMDHQPLHELLQNMAELVLELTNASSSFIHIVKGDDEWLELVAMAGNRIAELGQTLEKGGGLAGQAWLTGSVEYVEDYQRFAARLRSIDDVTQACALPMVIGGRVVGVLGIMYNDFREAIVDQLDLLQQFVTLASIAVENSVLLENTRNESIRNKIMNELGTVVFKSDSIDELFATTAETILTIIEGGSVDTWRLDKRGGLCSIAGWIKNDAGISHQSLVEVDANRSVVLTWLNDRQPNEHDDQQVSGYAALHELIVNSNDGTRGAFIPCWEEDGGGYLFYVKIAEDLVFSESIRNFLSAIGKQFSIALYRQKLQRQVRFQAYHDGLTTLPNRIQFDLSLQEALSAAEARGQQFAVLFIDLDGFKAVNDSMGHDTGDKLLVEVAQRFRRVLDESWVLARIGGDEFAAIITLQDYSAGVLATGNRLLASLHARFSFDKHAPEVGASIGSAIYPDDGATASQLLRNADLAMYEAKRFGKNCVCQFSDLGRDSNQWATDQKNVA